jgi:hypothetical protein
VPARVIRWPLRELATTIAAEDLAIADIHPKITQGLLENRYASPQKNIAFCDRN